MQPASTRSRRRMITWAVKKSMKRRRACSPAAAIGAGSGSAITSSLMAPHRARECASVRSAAAADKLLTVDHTSAFRSVFVTHRRGASRARAWAALSQLRCDQRAEFQHPAPHRLIGDVEPTLGEQFLHVSVAQREAEIKPHRMLNDLGRKAMTAIRKRSHGS
jgi:hypothetical protein